MDKLVNLYSELNSVKTTLQDLNESKKELEKQLSKNTWSIWETEREIESIKSKITNVANVSTDINNNRVDYDNGFFRSQRTTEGNVITFKNGTIITFKGEFKYFKDCIAYIDYSPDENAIQPSYDYGSDSDSDSDSDRIPLSKVPKTSQVPEAPQVPKTVNIVIVKLDNGNIVTVNVPIDRKMIKKSKYPEILFVDDLNVIVKLDIYLDTDYDSDGCDSDGEFYRRMHGFSQSDRTKSIVFISKYTDLGWSEFKKSTLRANNFNLSGNTSTSIYASGGIYANFDYRLIVSPDLKWYVVLEFSKHKSGFSSIFDKKNTRIYNSELKLVKKMERIENEEEPFNNDVVIFNSDNKLMIIGKKCKVYDPRLFIEDE